MKILLFTIFISFSAFAKEPQITVQGSCEMKVVPDRGSLSFTAENQFKDQKEAVAKTTEQINSLKKMIEELKLAELELKNSQYNVFPVREYEKERVVEKGYRASLTLEVTTSDIPRLGETIAKASSAGIVNVGSLMTFLSLEKGQQEYLRCLDVASDDARGKAKRLAKNLGFKIGDVISLNENPQVERQPMPMYAAMKTMADSAPTQIEAGTQKFSTNIQVTFSIK
jgi:uncharacterized protein YggE